MEGISILNREPNLRNDICHRINSKGTLVKVNKNIVATMLEYFNELKKNGKSISNLAGLKEMVEMVRQRNLAKVRVLKKQENGGYALISGITIIGTLALGAIIFITIKFILKG